MKKVRFTDEQMVRILREADIQPVAAIAKKHGVDFGGHLCDSCYPAKGDVHRTYDKASVRQGIRVEAVKLVKEQGCSKLKAAQSLDITN